MPEKEKNRESFDRKERDFHWKIINE